MSQIPLNKHDFERALKTLSQAYDRSKDSPGAYQSDNSERCHACMFTTHSQDCFHCTYCDHCKECSDCTHCAHCTNCSSSSYCVRSHHCVKSSYVLVSQHCYECLFCFGCVGLVKKEFHILNQPFPKKTYFELVEQLKVALGLN